jgi:hypothetical protein
MAISGISSTQLVIIAVIIVVTVLMLGNVRRKLRQRGPSPSEYAREQISRLKEHHEIKGDMEQLLVELHEAARRLNAQMDTKAARLEALIRDADERIAGLEAASAPDATTRAPAAQVGHPPAEHLDVAVDDSTSPAAGEERLDPLRHRIFTLAEKGKTPVEIAQDTGVQPGEVELILALHASGRRGRSASREA